MSDHSEIGTAGLPETLGEFMSTLKAGDSVFREYRGADLDKQRVSRVTKTQIILESGGRYSRATGFSVPATTWMRSNLVLPTPDVKKRWLEVFLSRWAKETFPSLFKNLTTQQQMVLYRQAQAFAATNKADASPDASGEENPCLS